MSAVAAGQPEVDPAHPGARHRPLWRRPVAWTVLAASLVAVGAAGGWLTHPNAFLESPTFEGGMNLPTDEMHAVAIAVIDQRVGCTAPSPSGTSSLSWCRTTLAHGSS